MTSVFIQADKAQLRAVLARYNSEKLAGKALRAMLTRVTASATSQLRQAAPVGASGQLRAGFVTSISSAPVPTFAKVTNIAKSATSGRSYPFIINAPKYRTRGWFSNVKTKVQAEFKRELAALGGAIEKAWTSGA